MYTNEDQDALNNAAAAINQCRNELQKICGSDNALLSQVALDLIAEVAAIKTKIDNYNLIVNCALYR